jgi:hypothetical protein
MNKVLSLVLCGPWTTDFHPSIRNKLQASENKVTRKISASKKYGLREK